jgi:penicillin-insensitive murein DD-endopeptidase
MPRLSILLIVLFASAAAPGAHAAGPAQARAAERAKSVRVRVPAPTPRPRSVGLPSDGRLENGMELPQSGVLKLKRPEGPRWGLSELVSLLERGAKRVEKRFPGSVLLVGDLSLRAGGDVGGHRSHESGRDADVGFYFVDSQGRPVHERRFRVVDWRGRAADAPALRFDDARNWALVEAWITDPSSRVEHIFVAKPLRARLLAYARLRGVYLPVLHRASLAMKQPSRGLPHDDHFHVRIACPRSQRGVCLADPPPARASVARRALVDRPKGRNNGGP